MLKQLFLDLCPEYSGGLDKFGYTAALAFDIQAAIWLNGGNNHFTYSPGLGDIAIDDEALYKEQLESLGLPVLERLSRYVMRIWALLERNGYAY